MLHARRKRSEEAVRREAAGESLWTDTFDQTVRTRLWAFVEAFSEVVQLDELGRRVSNRFRIELGETLPGSRTIRWSGVLSEAVRSLPDPLMPSLLEAVYVELKGLILELRRRSKMGRIRS